MCFTCVQKVCKVASAISLLSMIVCLPARSQGLMEYGGLMAMPKGIPGGDTIQNLTRGFGAIPNALPGASGQAAPQIPASIAIVRADGSVAVDPKKVAAATAKCNSDQAAAKQILAKSGATAVELKQAEKHLRDAITVRNSIWGYQDPAIPKLLNQLGGAYERMNQPAMAKSCYQNAITYVNKKFGFGSPERLDTFLSLAPLLVKEGDLSEALSLQQQIALIKERKSGPTSLDTIQARLTWAGTAKALAKPNAPDLYKQCLTDLDKAGGNISADDTTRLKGEIIPAYVEALKKAGRDDEAKEAASLLSSIAPAQTGTATAQAGTATAQAGTATAQAGTATVAAPPGTASAAAPSGTASAAAPSGTASAAPHAAAAPAAQAATAPTAQAAGSPAATPTAPPTSAGITSAPAAGSGTGNTQQAAPPATPLAAPAAPTK